jgi:hypothetical protein
MVRHPGGWWDGLDPPAGGCYRSRGALAGSLEAACRCAGVITGRDIQGTRAIPDQEALAWLPKDPQDAREATQTLLEHAKPNAIIFIREALQNKARHYSSAFGKPPDRVAPSYGRSPFSSMRNAPGREFPAIDENLKLHYHPFIPPHAPSNAASMSLDTSPVPVARQD